MKNSILLTVFAGLACVLAACSSTGGPLGLSPAQEKQIGLQEHPKILAAYGGEIANPEIRAYADDLTRRLLAGSAQPTADIKMTVLDSPVVNAFALPGHVYITRGLLALANSEAELAGVIGHEIGHVFERHTAERVSRSNVTGIGAALAGILSGNAQTAEAIGQAAQLYLLSYNRNQEYEADSVGVRLLANSGYDPLAAAYFLNTLGRWSALEGQIAGRERPPEFLSTHPNSANRVREAAEQAQVIETTGRKEINRDRYLNLIDGLLFGEDAYAQGYIQGNTFVHPEIGFAFAVPQGFQLQNSTSAVLARSQSGAQMQFTITGGQGTPQEILEGPMSQQLKTDFRPVQNGQVNGRPAAVGRGQLQTQQGNLDLTGYVIDWDGEAKYVFLWVTPPNLTRQLSGPINQSVNTLQQVDPARLNVPPTRQIDVVTARRGDSVRSLARGMAFPSYQEQRFRIINGLANEGAMPAGAKVKVIGT
ncbi:MAG: M48 family metalloprotease, partial [Pseudomonadota bacterium]